LQQLGLVQEIVKESFGGAHRFPQQTAQQVKAAVQAALNIYAAMPTKALLEARHERLMSYGHVALSE
jgi:acetyl-CoA carboxylase carboxyl transferase subunit alpha